MQVFNHNAKDRSGFEEIKLEPWEEIVGQLARFEKSPDMVSVYVSIPSLNIMVQLRFKSGTPEAKIITNKLQKELLGSYIAITRTDIIKEPLLIRRIKNGKRLGG